MTPNRPQTKNSSSFEYFLYVAIILETGLAAFVYKTIFRDPELVRLNIYFGIFYVGFLAWAIAQLNKLHRRRKAAESDPMPEMADPAPESPKTRSALGLTTGQLVIVIVVFVSAVATFSWALRLLR